MANGKNVSMFGSYPRSPAWELAQVARELVFLPEFDVAGKDSAPRAMKIQAAAVSNLLRLAATADRSWREQDSGMPEGVQPSWRPFDYPQEADRLDSLAADHDASSRLIDWAQGIQAKLKAT